MVYISNYKNDLKATNVVSDYLDKYFYTDKYFESIERVYDKKRQVSGIDVVCDFKGEDLYIDEKAAISYSNINDLSTYALEISFFNRSNKLMDGWFVSNDKKTTHYLFCWLDRNSEKKVKDLEFSDIYGVEVMLVNKIDLLNYIKKTYNYSASDLISLSNSMRESKKYKIRFSKLCKLNLSYRLREKPINLILDKEELRKLSIINDLIKSNSDNF